MFVEMDKMDGEMDVKIKKKKVKKKEKLESMKKEMDIVCWTVLESFLWIHDVLFCMDVSLFICSSMQDDHEITIDELELKYTTSVSKVTYKKNHKSV